MHADSTTQDTRETQETLWGGQTVRKGRRKSVRTSPPIEEGKEQTPEADIVRVPHVPRSGDPIETALYVASDLSTYTVTGHRGDLPTELHAPVMPEDAGRKGPTTWQRLTGADWRQLSGQLERIPMEQFLPDKAREIARRVAALVEWARNEGWQ